MIMSFVDIKSPYNHQDIISNNIQRGKPRFGVKLKGTWQGAVIINGCALRGQILIKMVNLQIILYEYWWYQNVF